MKAALFSRSGPRRSWADRRVVMRLWGISRPLTGTWLGLSLVGTFVPTVLAVATGVVVGQIPGVVRRGFGSAAGHRIVEAAVVMGAIMIAGDIIEAIRWRCSDLLGLRLRADQHRRIVTAVLAPAGVAHADDPDVLDAISGAESIWLRSLPDGLMNVAGNRLSGYAGAVLVARYDPVGAAVLAAAWFVAGRWKWRRAVEDATANLGEVRELRRSVATAELAISARAAKEVRLFGLGEWLGARYAREWSQAMAEIWRPRQGGFGQGSAVVGLVFGAHVLVFVRLAHAATSGHLGLTGLTIVLQGVLASRGIGAVPWGLNELHYGLRALPELERLESLVRDLPDLPGTEPAPTLGAAIRLENVRHRYPRADRDVLAGGRVVESGSHDALVSAGGLYAELYGLQARAYQS